MSLKFPKTLDEFKQLVESLDVEYPDQWVNVTEYKRTNVIQFLFLWGLWAMIENPSKSSYTSERVKRNREWANGNASRSLDPAVPLIEKFLEAGITPEEISELVMIEQSKLGYNFCYHLDDPNTATPAMYEENLVGLYAEGEYGVPIKEERLDCLQEIFWCAKPKSYSHDGDENA